MRKATEKMHKTVCLNIPNNGVLVSILIRVRTPFLNFGIFQTFNSIIVAALGFSIPNVQLLAIPTGVISWISSLVFSFIAVKTKKRCATAIAAALVPFAATIVLYLVPRSNVGGSLAGKLTSISVGLSI